MLGPFSCDSSSYHDAKGGRIQLRVALLTPIPWRWLLRYVCDRRPSFVDPLAEAASECRVIDDATLFVVPELLAVMRR
jgi:hypothetical protein